MADLAGLAPVVHKLERMGDARYGAPGHRLADEGRGVLARRGMANHQGQQCEACGPPALP